MCAGIQEVWRFAGGKIRIFPFYGFFIAGGIRGKIITYAGLNREESEWNSYFELEKRAD